MTMNTKRIAKIISQYHIIMILLILNHYRCNITMLNVDYWQLLRRVKSWDEDVSESLINCLANLWQEFLVRPHTISFYLPNWLPGPTAC